MARQDGLRVSTQPACSHFFSFTWDSVYLLGTHIERDRGCDIILAISEFPRYLTCKLGLATGRIHMGYCLRSLFLSSWLLFLFVFSIGIWFDFLSLLSLFRDFKGFYLQFTIFSLFCGFSVSNWTMNCENSKKNRCIFELQEVTMVSLKPSNCLIILEV